MACQNETDGVGRGRQAVRRGGGEGARSSVVAEMCHAVVLGVLFSLPSYLYSAVPFR